MESTKKPNKQARRADYVATVREGAIAANIFVGTTQDGLEYHYFRLSRAFKTAKQHKSDEFSYSDRFFTRNVEAMQKVTALAAKRCEELDAELNQAEPASIQRVA